MGLMDVLYCYARSARFWGGVNALIGSTAIASNPDAPAPGRLVQLLGEVIQPRLLTWRESDVAGQYAFERLRSRTGLDGYTVIAYDHTGVHDPVAKANLIPPPKPPAPAEHP